MDSTLKALGDLLVQAVPTIVFFIILTVYLKYVFFKPLAKILEQRREATEGVRELARRAFVTPQTMQAIIATLERDGLVTRMAHPVHGRVLTTELTPDGRSALRAAHEIVARAEGLGRDAVAPNDPEIIYSALLRIAEAMR